MSTEREMRVVTPSWQTTGPWKLGSRSGRRRNCGEFFAAKNTSAIAIVFTILTAIYDQSKTEELEKESV